MKKEELHREIDLFLVIAIIFILVFLFLYPTITGLTIYTQSYYNWTFSNPEDYTYNNSLIIIENNSAQLKLQSSTTTWTTINSTEFYITSAIYDEDDDKTDKLIALDDDKHTVKIDKTLDIIFDSNIQNNDIIALYLNTYKTGKIYLCEVSTFCEDNYGEILFPNIEGWYNITIQNLPSETNTLSILTNNSIKFNYIKVIRETEIQNSETNYSYPESAFLETSNLDIPDVNQNLLFSKNEELNNQIINYYYSNDNGLNYNLIPENNSLPSLQQIKIKTEFNSDTISTPILYNMILTYEYCTESWNCSSWSTCLNNNQTRTCTDSNECGTEENKPDEIDTCTYISPCTENWTCTDWSTCLNNNQTRTCSDSNSCNTTISQQTLIQNCTIAETPSSSSSSGGGGGSGGSTTFTKPTEKTTPTKTVSEETTPTPTPITKQEQQEIPLEIETKTPLQKVTGFVSYNVGREGINIILLTFLVSLSGLLYLKSKIIN